MQTETWLKVTVTVSGTVGGLLLVDVLFILSLMPASLERWSAYSLSVFSRGAVGVGLLISAVGLGWCRNWGRCLAISFLSVFALYQLVWWVSIMRLFLFEEPGRHSLALDLLLIVLPIVAVGVSVLTVKFLVSSRAKECFGVKLPLDA